MPCPKVPPPGRAWPSTENGVDLTCLITKRSATSFSSPIHLEATLPPNFAVFFVGVQTDGVSVISPVVLNGTRYGACYKGTGFEFNGYPAYYAEPLDTTADIQSERAVLVTTVEDVS